MANSHGPSGFLLADALAHHPYFRVLDPLSTERLARQALRLSFSAGEIVFLEGDPCAGLWIIEEGRAKVYRVDAEGHEHILHLLGPGDSFNDIAALDGLPNPASVAALSALTAWRISHQALDALLHENIDFALAAIRQLTQRVRGLVSQIEDLALCSVTVRLARFLLRQSEKPSLSQGGITRATIAAHLATTPETISRTLHTLEELGALRFDRHRIIIVNPDLLRTIAGL
ncbi:MAG TPA: Crp/Fnr family transcriptional regulator [Chloroflexi bacterium]|nr:Crp/Fnr family transcriptional regulator [Chloroflexota bacterium]